MRIVAPIIVMLAAVVGLLGGPRRTWRRGHDQQDHEEVGHHLESAGDRIVSKERSARLGTGTYTVRTVVTYKAKNRSGGCYASKTVRRFETLKIRKAATCGCATSADASPVAIGDTRAEVDAKLHSHGRLD